MSFAVERGAAGDAGDGVSVQIRVAWSIGRRTGHEIGRIVRYGTALTEYFEQDLAL